LNTVVFNDPYMSRNVSLHIQVNHRTVLTSVTSSQDIMTDGHLYEISSNAELK